MGASVNLLISEHLDKISQRPGLRKALVTDWFGGTEEVNSQLYQHPWPSRVRYREQ